MLVPIRCFSCGKPIAQLYEDFVKRKNAGEDPAKTLTDLGLKRYCCRRMLLTQGDMAEDVMAYEKF